ncbi:MAG: GNAT family N-acetyltransferase [Bdellovibrionales bacterium]
MDIKEITAQETHALRLEVLRPGGKKSDVEYAEDETLGSFHLGAYNKSQLIGIASFFPENYHLFPTEKCFRLRGMASSPRLKVPGTGTKLILTAVELIREKKGDLLWCNAREVAFPFYEKVGFSYLGPMFDIPKIGPHKVMYRKL